MTAPRRKIPTVDATKRLVSTHGIKSMKTARNLETIFRARYAKKRVKSKLNRLAVINGIEAELATKHGRNPLLRDLIAHLKHKFL